MTLWITTLKFGPDGYVFFGLVYFDTFNVIDLSLVHFLQSSIDSTLSVFINHCEDHNILVSFLFSVSRASDDS